MDQFNLETFYKLVRFGIVGLIGMAVDFGTTWLVREKIKWNQYVANSCGFTLAVINNYLLNRYWTFNSNQNWFPEFGKFVLFSGFGLYSIILCYTCFTRNSKYVFIWQKLWQ